MRAQLSRLLPCEEAVADKTRDHSVGVLFHALRNA